MRFQRSIVTNTERFMNDDGLIARAAVALADQRLAADVATAQSQIFQDLTRIRDVFAGLGEKLDLIDRFSHKLERRIATTVRYQETARNVREERLRDAIRLAFVQWNSGVTECVTPLVDIPIPYSTATLALPKKAREPVEPQTRRPKTIDPADAERDKMIDAYVASMDVAPHVIAERLSMLTTTDAFYDLDALSLKMPATLRFCTRLDRATSDQFRVSNFAKESRRAGTGMCRDLACWFAARTARPSASRLRRRGCECAPWFRACRCRQPLRGPLCSICQRPGLLQSVGRLCSQRRSGWRRLAWSGFVRRRWSLNWKRRRGFILCCCRELRGQLKRQNYQAKRTKICRT